MAGSAAYTPSSQGTKTPSSAPTSPGSPSLLASPSGFSLSVFPFTLYLHLPFPLAHLHPCLPTPHLGCGINTIVADPLLPACGGGRGRTAHAQPAWPRDAVIGTCQTAATHFRKSTGAFIVLLLAGTTDPPSGGYQVSVLAPTLVQLSPGLPALQLSP